MMNLHSVVLSIGAANGVVLMALLLPARRNRLANRLLAALIGVAVLRVAVYIIGYAGAYDRWRWLTFLPLDNSLAIGPLLWAYVVALTTDRLPARFGAHLLPVALQFGYQLACFCLPLDLKWDWYTGTDRRLVAPAFQWFGIAQLGLCLVLAQRAFTAYTRWLDAHLSDAAAGRMDWLRTMLLAMTGLWAVSAAYAAWQGWVAPLDYFGRFPLMIAFCVMVYVLGLLGWRFGTQAWPTIGPIVAPVPAVDDVGVDAAAGVAVPVDAPADARVDTRTDYRAMAERWRVRVAEAGWWRQDDLTLGDTAQKLGVSERSLSRGLATGLGETFSSFVNRMRVEAVAARLDAGDDRDLLTLAFEAGFASKASFNRAFKTLTGETPSGRRDRVRGCHIPPSVSPGGS